MAQDETGRSAMPRARVTRRGVVAGAAWAVPVVALGLPARAAAASCAPGAVCMTRLQNTTTTSNCANGGLRYTFLGNSGPRGVSFSNTTTATVITGLTITFWLRSSTLNVMWGNTMPLAWSNPAYSGATRVVNGVTYYGYVATYLQTIAPVNGTTIIRYNFNTCIPLAFSGDRLIQTDAVVNGSSQSIITGVLPALPPNVTVTE